MRSQIVATAAIGWILSGLIPGTTVGALASESLPLRVQSMLRVRDLPADSLSVFVADLATGETVLEWNGDVARNPASTMKLVTTLVALDVLGPSYRWKTDVYALGQIEDGRLRGDLLLKGYGDPFLVTERVWQLLRRVQQLGVREVDGDLLLDDSFFDVEPHDPAGFDRQPLRAYNVAPNALMMNYKVVRYWFEPDMDANSVRVVLDPPLDNLRVDNRLSLEDRSCRGYQRGISITPEDDFAAMIFEGRFPARCERYAMDRSALDHDAFAYGLVSSLWQQLGGEIRGQYRRAVAPDEAEPLLSFASLSLTEAIARVNKYSNNVMARQLLYTLSAEALGAPGTEDGGRRVIDDWLSRHVPDVNSVILDNGAGLSREARISAADFAEILQFAWQQPYMPEFSSSLALSGHDGTLRRKFDDVALIGKAHLKTGSLDHVSAIAGYLQARSGRRFAVTVLQNFEDVHRGPGEEVQWAVLRWLYDQ